MLTGLLGSQSDLNCRNKISNKHQYFHLMTLGSWKCGFRSWSGKLTNAKRKIGKGAFATVYLAERLRDGKSVAVKAFSKEKQFAGEKGKSSLENQIRVMRKLSHPNAVKLEGVYQTQNSIYLILEYLEGVQLNDLLKSGRKLLQWEIKDILRSLLRGLSHMNSKRIIHRDLKPQNLIFKQSDKMEVVICDFGLATYADQDKYIFVRCGTPGFVAPQIINIKDMNTKSEPISDMFSVGIIFHYLLLGCSVFPGKKYNDILNQNRQCDFNFERDIYCGLESNAYGLLKSMLEKDPLKRISADRALQSSYFNEGMEIEGTKIERTKNERLLKQLSPNFNKNILEKQLSKQSFQK